MHNSREVNESGRSQANKLAPEPDVSVILVSFNTAHLLGRVLCALQASAGGVSLETFVVDNCSRDGSVDVLRTEHRDVELLVTPTNVGFGRANNLALNKVRGRYVLLLNTDAFVEPATLRKTVDFMDRHVDCGVLGVKLTGEDGAIQPSCRFFPTPWSEFLAATGLWRWFPRTQLVDDPNWDPEELRDCDWVPGCYYLIRREVVAQVGLFDPRYFLYYEEVDHCRAVKAAGWRVVYFPHTSVIHLGGESAQSAGAITSGTRQISALQLESEMLYMRKHHGLFGLLQHLTFSAVGQMLRALRRLARLRPSSAARELAQIWPKIVVGIRTRLGSKPLH